MPETPRQPGSALPDSGAEEPGRSDRKTLPKVAFSNLTPLIPDSEGVLEQGEFLSREAIRELLSGRIQYLLNHKRELLFSILYRIDVSEKVVKSVFSQAAPDAIPDRLADLVIDRQLQKLAFRRRHSNGLS